MHAQLIYVVTYYRARSNINKSWYKHALTKKHLKNLMLIPVWRISQRNIHQA